MKWRRKLVNVLIFSEQVQQLNQYRLKAIQKQGKKFLKSYGKVKILRKRTLVIDKIKLTLVRQQKRELLTLRNLRKRHKVTYEKVKHQP